MFFLSELVKKANDYIDDFVQKATNGSGGFIDPLPLDDIEKSIEKEAGFVRVKAEARLYGGKIYGLSTLKRKGDAVVVDLDDFLIISCQLTFKKIYASYKGAIQVNEKGPKFDMNARIGSSKVSMFIMVPPEGGKADLMSFNINKLQDIRISILGLGPMGWTASFLSTIAMNALEQPVAKAASLKVFEHFSKEIDKVPYPGNEAY